VEPSSVERGQSALLRWQVKDAADIAINQGVGTANASGSRRVSPGESTTYTLTAKGPGGSATASATLNVTLPPPPPAVKAAPAPDLSERLSKEVQDAFFDFDKNNIRPDAQAALTKDAGALKAILSDFPNATVAIEGHCDERGSAEYNVALGDRRASAAKEFLTQLGVPADRLVKISYGKERPQCTESDETCWQKNRRVHFAPGQGQQPKAELNVPGSLQDAAPQTGEGQGNE
jgi:peptidoglycan-associated lipoprotein